MPPQLTISRWFRSETAKFRSAPAAASRQCTDPSFTSFTSGATAPDSAMATLFASSMAMFQRARAPYLRRDSVRARDQDIFWLNGAAPPMLESRPLRARGQSR